MSDKSTFWHEARHLIVLAGPIVLTQLGQMAIGTTDVLMLGAYSKDALAASSLGLSIYVSLLMFSMGPTSAVAPLIAHVLGAGSKSAMREVAAVVRMAFWAVAMTAPFLIAIFYFTGDILLLIGEPEDLAAGAGLFARIFGASLPFVAGFNVLRSYSTALSRPNAALIVMGLEILFNAFADYVLIFGHFGAPELGLKGAAIASLSSNVFVCFAMTLIVLVHPTLRRYRVFSSFFKPNWPKLVELFHLGIPIGLTLIFEVLFFCSGALIMGHFGAAAVAAHQIAMTTASTTFMVPLGIAMAATVRVGLAAGADDWPRVRRAALASVALGTGFMSLCALLIAIAPERIAGLYVVADLPENRPVIATAVTFLYFAAAFQLMDALQVTASLCLRGLKDATMPMWLAGGCYWLIGFPTAFILSFDTPLRGVGVWVAFSLALVIAAATLSYRFARLSGMLPGRLVDTSARSA